MNGKMKVKVIKKNEVKAAAPSVVAEKKQKQRGAREMVSNVTNWVSDFQQRKRDETKLAIEKVFSPQARPSES